MKHFLVALLMVWGAVALTFGIAVVFETLEAEHASTRL